jgi:3-oxoacyl-[acyl-carrier-protein] synthase II
MERRVVVTGLGAVTPLGPNVAQTWQGLKEGRSGIGPITRFDASAFATKIAGECREFEPTSVLGVKEARRMDRFQQMAYAAAVEALQSARYEIAPHNADRVGVIVGSGIGGIETLSNQFRVLYDRGPSRVSPFLIPMMIVDLAPGMISILLGAKGPNFSTVSACATGSHAIGEAAEMIRQNKADAMLAGGAEAGITEIGVAGFCSMRALSTRNAEPERASRPFDAARDGFVMSEGAGVLLLEEYESARSRGATVLAELIGYGATADAHHITEPAPRGEGAARAMVMALDGAGIRRDEVRYINAHATSTVVGDIREIEAIKDVFGEHAYRLAVGSTKSMTGHLLGAAGGVEAIVSVLVIREGFIPPTTNLDAPDAGIDLDCVPNTGRSAPVPVAMSNSFGFGGHNATLLFRAVA